jgi:hypothetical protein
VLFTYKKSSSTLSEQGRSSASTTDNWISLSGIDMTLFPSGSLEVGFNNNEIDTLTWNGTVSTSWNTVDNWTPNGAPSDFVNIIIPDASSTPGSNSTSCNRNKVFKFEKRYF